ncbi:hypothetical protein ACSSZE_05830 [Acidithiobacillus caldus]
MKKPDFTIPGHEFYRGTFIPEGDEAARAMVDREMKDPRMAQLCAMFDATTDAHDECILLDEMNRYRRQIRGDA